MNPGRLSRLVDEAHGETLAGISAAVSRNSAADVGIMGATQLGVAIPNFWFAMLLVLVFAIDLRWLPMPDAAKPLVPVALHERRVLRPEELEGRQEASTPHEVVDLLLLGGDLVGELLGPIALVLEVLLLLGEVVDQGIAPRGRDTPHRLVAQLAEPGGQLDRHATRFRLADHRKSPVRVQQGTEPMAHHRMVLRQQHPNPLQ